MGQNVWIRRTSAAVSGRPTLLITLGWWCGRKDVATHNRWCTRLSSNSAGKTPLDEIGCSITDILGWTIVSGSVLFLQCLRSFSTSKANTSVAAVCRGHQTSLAQIILGFQILDFRLIRPIYYANRYAENRIALVNSSAVVGYSQGSNVPVLFH